MTEKEGEERSNRRTNRGAKTTKTGNKVKWNSFFQPCYNTFITFVVVWSSSCGDVDGYQNGEGGGQQESGQPQSACVKRSAVMYWRHGALG